MQRMLVFFRRRKDALYAFRKVLEFPEGKLTWLTYFLLREMFGFLGKNVGNFFFYPEERSGRVFKQRMIQVLLCYLIFYSGKWRNFDSEILDE